MHRNHRLSPYGRQLLVDRILIEGWSVSTAARACGVSRATAYKWLTRFQEEGQSGLEDRSSRPASSPTQLAPAQEAKILLARRERKLGPHRLAALTGHPRSTCYRVLVRNGLSRLDWMDR